MAKRITQKEVENRVKSKGFKLVGNYTDTQTKTEFQCSKGHIWQTKPNAIFTGKGCAVCRGFNKTIEEINNVVNPKGIECLSKKYSRSKDKMFWKCSFGHEWEATCQAVMYYTGCPTCAGSNGERISKSIIEKMFDLDLPKKRPKWLYESTGRHLELDGYNEKEKIAFEYHGIQHYKPHGKFLTIDLKERKKLDKLKEKACLEQGINLIVIKYFDDIKSLDEILLKIEKAVLRTGLKIPKQWDEKKHQINFFSQNNDLSEMQKLATERNGKCLSNYYINARSKLKFKCKEGHIFSIIPNAIRNGQWCSKCGGSHPLNIEICKDDAVKRGEKCVSKKYTNSITHLEYVCSKKHKYSCTPKNYRKGRGCPECAKEKRYEKRRLGIGKMQKVAKEMGGECLSKIYINNCTKLKWKCKKGHIWEAVYENVISKGTWCPKCR